MRGGMKMGRIRTRKREMSERQKNAMTYALKKIQQSPIAVYVKNVILYGSCARGEASWGSDVDLCVLLNEDVRKLPNYAQIIHLLKGTISEDDAHSAETDIKFVIGDEWQNSGMLYLKNLRKDGIPVWQ
jgi:predicted nucleotidyltransferase